MVRIRFTVAHQGYETAGIWYPAGAEAELPDELAEAIIQMGHAVLADSGNAPPPPAGDADDAERPARQPKRSK